MVKSPKSSASDEKVLKTAVKLIKRLWKTEEGRELVAKCIPEPLGRQLAASITSRLRTVKKGAKQVFYPCPYCGKEFTAREIRKHKPYCPEKPTV